MNLCPLCSNPLTLIDVAPCFDCGHSPRELDGCRQEAHRYYVCQLWDRELVLCDFCYADFGSYFPDYWGMPAGPLPDYPLDAIRELDRPGVAQDMYCTTCQHRLAFLLFRHHALARNIGEFSPREHP
nr:hypothetical protein [uncultured Pseudoxanthomonas sp.]